MVVADAQALVVMAQAAFFQICLIIIVDCREWEIGNGVLWVRILRLPVSYQVGNDRGQALHF